MFFKTKLEKKKEKLADKNYDNLPNWTLNGRVFYSKILDVYDGDTVTISIKIDNLYFKMNCRLSGIDTPEMRGGDENEKIAAIKARNHLIFLLSGKKLEGNLPRKDIREHFAEVNSILQIKCGEFDKYGRLLIEIIKEGYFVNNKMISDGFAGEYSGKTKSNWETYFRH